MFTALGVKEERDFSLLGRFFFLVKKRNPPMRINLFLSWMSINQSCKHAGNRPIDKDQDYSTMKYTQSNSQCFSLSQQKH